MHLTEDDKMVCAQVVRQYLAGKITDPVAAGMCIDTVSPLRNIGKHSCLMTVYMTAGTVIF